MLDNLRNQATFQEEEPLDTDAPNPPKQRKRHPSFDRITGMTAPQRFVLAVMFSIVVCLLGTLFLVISGMMVPSFLF